LNPIFIIFPVVMLSGKKKAKKRKKHALGDISYFEAEEIMRSIDPHFQFDKPPPSGTEATSPVVEPLLMEMDSGLDFSCYDCEKEEIAPCPLLDVDGDEPDAEGDREEVYWSGGEYDEREDDEGECDDERGGGGDVAEALARCDKFLDAVYVAHSESGEIPINEIAVKRQIIPAMISLAKDISSSSGRELDPEEDGIQLILAGLEAIAPACGWAFHEEDSSWTYAYGEPIRNRHAEILDSMFPIAVEVIERNNREIQVKNV
jgi:hypothetical protein